MLLTFCSSSSPPPQLCQHTFHGGFYCFALRFTALRYHLAMQFPFSALLLVFFEVLPFRIVLTCCTPKPTFLHKNYSGVALGSLANFNCLKQLYFCRKCLTTNSCLTFTFFYCSLEAQKIFYSSKAKVLHFLCRCSGLPLPNSCSSIATFLLANCLLFRWHISVHPTPKWLLCNFFCYISLSSLLFHCQLVALQLPNGCSSIATFLLFHC